MNNNNKNYINNNNTNEIKKIERNKIIEEIENIQNIYRSGIMNKYDSLYKKNLIDASDHKMNKADIDKKMNIYLEKNNAKENDIVYDL